MVKSLVEEELKQKKELEEIFENHGNSINYVYRQICRDLLEKGHPADTAAATKGKSKELIVTTELEPDGSIKLNKEFNYFYF